MITASELSGAARLASDSGSSLAPGLPRRLHLLGAGGAGLSGAAKLLAARGHELSGHDRESSPFVLALQEAGVPVAIGDSRAADLPASAAGVVRSAAVAEDDPQVLLARERGLPILKYSELLGRLAPLHRTLAVAGTHGKTTTSWMLLHALRGLAQGAPEALAPGALIGGVDQRLGTNALAPGREAWFAAEACEYDRSFLQLAPRGAILTNVEADHLDCFGTMEKVEEAFARFACGVHPDGLLVVGPGVPERVWKAAPCDVWRLGREFSVDLLSEQKGRFEFRLRGPGWATPALRLAVPGEFNVQNAALALALAVGLAAREPGAAAAAAAASGLATFAGVARRFETWGSVGEVDVVHDYAHHPTEVGATLEAARRAYPGADLHVLFQPHQHSRTMRFMDDFVEVLRGADRVVAADVYGARKHIDRGVDADPGRSGAEELVRRLTRAGVDATHGGGISASALAFGEGLTDGALGLVLGAGDIDTIRDELLDRLAVRRSR